ncbi:hypothetical protein SAMN04488689_106344 [Paenibacillus sp. cl6col]|nr:hypothetical protein SAMN04488689_106344 [Paenibacillus sp. cl6col]
MEIYKKHKFMQYCNIQSLNIEEETMHSGKFLVVDDDWKMGNLVRIYLKKDGYELNE